MLVRLAIRLITLGVVIGVATAITPGIHFHGSVLWLVWVALIFALVNLVLGPLLTLISLPLVVLTFGLFMLVVNAGLLAITAGLTKHLDIDNFGAAVLGGLLIVVLSWVVQLLVPVRPRRSRRRTERRSSAADR